MTEEDRQIERLTNLTFAFLGAEKAGRQFLTGEWLRGHVKGCLLYTSPSPRD